MAASSLRFAAALAAATGCAPDTSLEHTAAWQGDFAQVVVGADGGDLHAVSTTGSIGRFVTATGEVLEEFEPVAGEPEGLHDVVEDDGTAVVLASGQDRFYVWEGAGVSEPLSAEDRGGGVLGARQTSGGTAVLRNDVDDGCVVEWILPGDVRQMALPQDACASPCVTASRADDRLLVTASGATWSVGPSDLDEWLSEGDVCAFDQQSGALVVGQVGNTSITATTAFGDALWSVGLPSDIVAVADLGETGGFAVAGDQGSKGQIVLVDGPTGEPTTAVSTPVPGAGLSGGGRGKVLAVWLATEVHIFQLQPGQ